MFQEMMISAGGGGTNCFFYKGTASQNPSSDWIIDLGRLPSIVIAYMSVGGTSVTLRYDVESGKIYQTAGSNFEIDNTSFYNGAFVVSGNTVTYKAVNSGYEVPTVLTAY